MERGGKPFGAAPYGGASTDVKYRWNDSFKESSACFGFGTSLLAAENKFTVALTASSPASANLFNLILTAERLLRVDTPFGMIRKARANCVFAA